MRPLIIERPERQSQLQRWGYRWVTLAGWALWLYLFAPLLSLVAWVLGATLIYHTLLQGLEITDLGALLLSYGSGILLLCGVFVVWAATSYLRFRGVDRRRAPRPVDADALRRSHRLHRHEHEALQSARRLVLPREQLERMFALPAPADDERTEPRAKAA